MTRLRTEVLAIGGGATGTGVAWDAALRGFDVVLVDRADLAERTSGRFHGLLHSGGRYVVKDPVAADECVAENAILRRVIPGCIEDTGGLFVTTQDDDPAYGDVFMDGCRRAGLPAEEIGVAEAVHGDILVPIRTVSVIGSTDIRADPDELPVTQAEVDQLLDDGERLVPGFRDARALRVWAGVRPLWHDEKAGPAVANTRDVSRTHAVVDHSERDGVERLLTMSGGKLTTLQLMAQDIVDAMCQQLGEQRPCRTHETSPAGNEDGELDSLGSRLRRREASLQDEQLVCECELIGRRKLEETSRRRGTSNLDDIRRSLRLGMGPCQGGFCIYRLKKEKYEIAMKVGAGLLPRSPTRGPTWPCAIQRRVAGTSSKPPACAQCTRSRSCTAPPG